MKKFNKDYPKEVWKCPKCKRNVIGYPAVSRIDDRDICTDCGINEALNDFRKHLDSIEKTKYCDCGNIITDGKEACNECR